MKTPQNDRISDKVLIAIIVQGGRARNTAIGELYRQTALKTKSVLLKMSLDKMEIEELHSDALILCIENICDGKYRQLSSLSTYIVGIAILKGKNLFRKNKRRWDFEFPEQEAISISPEELLEIADDNNKIYKVLNILGDPCKTLLWLWAQSYSFKEIVEQLHYSTENSAKVQKFKCLKKLRDLLDKSDFI